MAQRYDVPGRLAEGREAVERTQTYVSACHRRGYRHPELTGYDGQLADHYDGESGLDLRSLDADCAALNALAAVADDVLRTQRQQLVELDHAWHGSGADVTAEFLRRHCDAAAQLTAGLRAAATACGVLRDELWRLVDDKVAAVLAVDERVDAHRHSWLTAAHAVTSGAADGSAAEVVDKQVMPYVADDVGGEWVAAVRKARDGIDAAYRAAVAAAEPAVGVVFAIPGDLAPVGQSDGAGLGVPSPVVQMAGPGVVPPAQPAAVAPVPPTQAGGNPAPAAALDDLPGDLDRPGALGLPSDLGFPSGGLPGGAGGGLGGLAGLGGLIPRLVDALGNPGDGQPFDQPFDDDAGPTDTEHADLTDTDDADPTDTGDPAEPEPAEADTEPDSEDPTTDVPVDDVEPEPAAETTDNGDSEADEAAEPTEVIPPKTPCEIAAEELPQVGQ
ncbi:hypothetical protein A5735_20135 [Mycolicibacter heraklionensis]|nr:hypothetical protein A5735_20135 [Mycolicibacter heraklionensis]